MARPRGSWQDMSGRERVRAVVETLDGAAPVGEIADRADVSRATADDELERLAADNRVRERLVDGKRGYELDPVSLFLDEIATLVREHTREELEAELERLTAERDDFREEFDADALQQFRERLAERTDLTATEIRERRNVAASWEAVVSEATRVRHALSLYDDVSELTTTGASEVPSRS